VIVLIVERFFRINASCVLSKSVTPPWASFVVPWGLCSDWWDIPVINLSDRGWRCVTFDRRGHGRSDDPSRGYDFDTLADDIASVIDGLDLENVVLVGHSLGGAEVVRYLTRHRSRHVGHAILIAPTTPGSMKTDENPGGTPREPEKNRESLKHDLPRLAALAAPDFFGLPTNFVSNETMEWWCRMFLDRCSIKVLSELFKAMNETDFRAELRTIQTPTLILQGDIDKSVPLEKSGRPTHELMPAAACWCVRMPHTVCRTRTPIACSPRSSRLRKPSRLLKDQISRYLSVFCSRSVLFQLPWRSLSQPTAGSRTCKSLFIPLYPACGSSLRRFRMRTRLAARLIRASLVMVARNASSKASAQFGPISFFGVIDERRPTFGRTPATSRL
jgi:non-heme chloroperoxidase